MNRLIILTFTFIASCSSSPKGEGTFHNSNQSLTIQHLLQSSQIYESPSSRPYLYDEGKAFAENVKTRGLAVATKQVCDGDENHPICHIFSRSPVKRTFLVQSYGNAIGGAKVKIYLKKHQFAELTAATVNDVIQGAKRLSQKDLKSTTQSILSESSCQKSELYVGIASVLELNFPDSQNVTDAKSLLSKATQCGKDDLAKYAAYRLGVFSIWNNDCNNGVSQLNASAGHSQNYYQSRVEYWKNWCKSRAPEKENREPAAFYAKFPLSLYPLLGIDSERFDAYKVVKGNDEQAIQYRSRKNELLNTGFELSELFLSLQEPNLSAKIFERIDILDLQKESVALQLYAAYHLELNSSDLLKFQLLSKLFQTSPSLKTLTTMKLFYPIRHLNQIKQVSSEIDPFLIMALIRQESAFNKNARSQKNARGLMQLTSALAKSFGYAPKEMFDPNKNINAGVQFFRHLLKRYNGNVHLALAAYNAGPKMVDAWVKRYPTSSSIMFMDLIPFRETREYVAAILRNWYWYSNLYADGENQPHRFVQIK